MKNFEFGGIGISVKRMEIETKQSKTYRKRNNQAVVGMAAKKGEEA